MVNYYTVFIQDGATTNYALIVKGWLKERFPAEWIGRGGLHDALTSPGVTFFVGIVKIRSLAKGSRSKI